MMMVSNAFRIGTVLLIFAIIDRFVPIHSFDGDEFTNRAVNAWVSKTFLQSYLKFILPTDDDVADGAQLYSEKKEPNFDGNGKSGLNNVPVDRIKDIIDLWKQSDLISNEAVSDMQKIIEQKNFKKITEYVHSRANGDLVYAIVGFVEMKSDESRDGTVCYSFRQFKLQGNPDVVVGTPSIDNERCMLWGLFCPTNFKVTGFNDGENQSLFNYMRSVAIKAFAEDASGYVDFYNKEAERYQRFLPSTFSDDLTLMENNPNKLPTELFSEDPFQISKY